jgi:hypothetical protein
VIEPGSLLHSPRPTYERGRMDLNGEGCVILVTGRCG